MPNTHTVTQSDCHGLTLRRDTFLAHYVAAWMAAQSVARHRENAMTADQHQAPEDALCCAEAAWDQLVALT